MKTVILIAHWDCGAYGGNKVLGGGEEEKAKYTDDLRAAAKVINNNFPEINVELLLAKPEGEKVNFETIV